MFTWRASDGLSVQTGFAQLPVADTLCVTSWLRVDVVGENIVWFTGDHSKHAGEVHLDEFVLRSKAPTAFGS